MYDVRSLLQKHQEILSILNKEGRMEQAKLVGGCVRDFLLSGEISEDVDISTTLKPYEVIKIMDKYRKQKGISCILIDKDKRYGTIIVIFNGQRYEITSTRADIACFGRQATVEFCDDFQKDSERRDFTINALYVGLDGKILDFHNGLNDLSQGIIRFIGDPQQRIEEDFLRIIRFFRFATKFNFFDFDKNVLQVIKLTKHGLKNVSRERIRSEIFKLLEYKNWFIGLENITKVDLMEEVFGVKNITTNNLKVDFIGNKIVELFYFFNFSTKVLEDLKKSFKFTKEECKFADFLISFWNLSNGGKDFNIDVKMLVFYSKNQYMEDVFPILNKHILEQTQTFLLKKKPLNIKSTELIKLGYVGKELGEKIKQLEKEWVKSDFMLPNDDLLSL